MKEHFCECCNGLLTSASGGDNPHFSYVQIISRGDLAIPSTNLVNYICKAFAILKFLDDLIIESGLTVRKMTVSNHSRHFLAPHMKQLHEKS